MNTATRQETSAPRGNSKPLTQKERAEHDRLGRLWATQRATRKQMERFQELNRRPL